MVNQQTLSTNKPVLNLWFNGDSLIKTPPAVYDFQGKLVEQTYFTTIQNFLISQFKNFCKIKLNTFDNHTVDNSSINICPIICEDLAALEYAIKNIDYSLYNKCVENNIIYFLGLTREHIDAGILGANLIHKLIQEHIVDKGCSPNHFKIHHVGYGIPEELNDYKDYIITIDSCSRILANTTTTKVSNALPLDRSYNFSVLTGSLRDRNYRCMFLARCNKLGILDDKFFYTMVMNNYSSDLQHIKETFADMGEPYRSEVLDSCDELFYNKTYDKDGKLLTDKTVYNDNIEWDVPKQVLDSYVNIVLETQVDSSSITEKTYKPLMVGLPFIWHGPQNILPYLTSLGYKKYKHIDYSFDAHPDPTVRMDLLIQEVQRLGKKDLRSLVKLNQDISEHNRKHFWNTANNYNDLWNQLK